MNINEVQKKCKNNYEKKSLENLSYSRVFVLKNPKGCLDKNLHLKKNYNLIEIDPEIFKYPKNYISI